MKQSLFSIGALLMSAAVCSAQNSLTIDETVPGSPEYYKHFAPMYSTSAMFTENGNQLMVFSGQDISAFNGKTTSELKLKKSRELSILAFKDNNTAVAYCNAEQSIVEVDATTLAQRTIISGVESRSFDMAPITRYAAYSEGNALAVATADTSIIIGNGDAEGIVYGQSVHRNEFGINGGTFWSPCGTKLAFYRMDESMVTEYPLVDVNTRVASTFGTRYPMAGETSHIVTIGVLNTADMSVRYLKTPDPTDRYFTNIAWTPDSKKILVAEINRDQNHMDMNVYDAASGELLTTLFSESRSTWVEPMEPALFTSNNTFLWLSYRDGFRHLYLYNLTDGTSRQITSGNWDITQLYGYSPKEKRAFFQSNRGNYLNKHIFSVDMKGNVRQLTSGDGVHNAQFCGDFSKFVDRCSSVETAMSLTLHDSRGKMLKELAKVENPYDGYTLPEIKSVELRSADNKYDLTGCMVLPADFDSTKTYPAIVYVYGGPHSQMVTNAWNHGLSTWKLYFAQQGYIVFTMDNRGTEMRGMEFQEAIHRQLGQCEMADQMVGVDYLKSLPYVDSSRIGVHGWSYGGFMTISLMLNHNNTFKAGVAGGPVTDWSLYEVMYGERYMDTPQQNPEGYALTNVCNKVGNLKGRLLVIHGAIDPTVVWQNSLQLLNKSIENDVIIDYAVYPNHEHNVIGPDRVHLIKTILRYFDDHLK